MAVSKSFLLFFLVLLCPWVFVGFCQGQGDTLPCVQKLMSCQPYLKADSPPASCCVPLKQLVSDDKDCLCKVLNNPGILQSLNITKADAVNLAKNCGTNADLSVCNNSGQGDTLPCVQKLMPCQPYLKADSPPASCCVPLKQLVSDDKDCLCKVLNNPGILQSLNITKADAVNLAKNCGTNADLSVCNNSVTPSPGSSVTPSPPSNGTTPSPPPKGAASVASFHVGIYLSLLLAVLIFTESSSN